MREVLRSADILGTGMANGLARLGGSHKIVTLAKRFPPVFSHARYHRFLALLPSGSLLFLLFARQASAQFYNGYEMEFERNRVQYDDRF